MSTSAWTSAADVRHRARRSWTDGSVLRAYLGDQPCPVLDFPVRGPRVRELGPHLDEVRAWREGLISGSRSGAAYAVIEQSVGGRGFGRVSIPARVQVADYDQWWRLLGCVDEVRVLDEIHAETRRLHPALVPWLARRPLRAIELASEWGRLMSAISWLVAHAGAGRYLREVTAPGIDTKFIERHSGVLGEWLDLLRPDAADRSASARTFGARHGFAVPERLLAMRIGPAAGARALPGLGGATVEVGLRLADAARLDLPGGADVLIVENQVTYLSAPVHEGDVVIWGHGFDAGRLGRLPWLRDATRVRYWGDIDTHGFAILNQLRAQVPAAESVLMDRRTLLQHRDRWVDEARPTRADLTHLTAEDRLLYEDLVSDAFGIQVRLEQERTDWSWALAALQNG